MSDIALRILDSFRRQGLMETLGARLVEIGDGEVHVALPFSATLTQQQGFLHAGVVTTIADNACGYAALSKAPPDHEVVTAEFKVNFLRPAIGSRFLAIGKVVNAGRSLAVCTAEVRAFGEEQDEGKVVALMQATLAFVRP